MNVRSIRIYLVEGQASGLLTAEVMNWSGKMLVSPSSNLADLENREEISTTGIVAAGNTNGRVAWKTTDTRQTYGDWHQSQLPADEDE